MGKLERFAAKTFGSEGFVGSLSRRIVSSPLRRMVFSSAPQIQAVLHRRDMYLGQRPLEECSEAVLYELIEQGSQSFLAALSEILKIDGDHLNAEEVRFAFMQTLVSFERGDELLSNRINSLEDPVAKAFLKLLIRNKKKALDFCRYMEENGLNSIDELLKNLPDILRRLSEREEELLLGLELNGKGKVVKGFFEMMLEINRATRGK